MKPSRSFVARNYFNCFKSILQKSEIPHHSSATINLPSNYHPPLITHPEECIWAEQTPRRQLRAPDAPKIKHDRMKQFYMVDMGLKT